MTDVLIIGVGNEYRCDDGIGIAVALTLHRLNLPGVVVLEASGAGSTLMELWSHADCVILVDAVSSGSALGTIHRFDVAATPIPAPFFRHSTHAFGVHEAIELARTLGQLPHQLIVYGIEGKTFSYGTEMSPKLEESAQTVVRMIANDLKVLVPE